MMAAVHGVSRVRFVGRPGRRFTQLLGGHPHLPSSSLLRNSPDPKTSLLVNVHTDLRKFYQIVGDSSDEDEFDGFTEEDIGLCEYKSKAIQESIKRLEDLTSTVHKHAIRKAYEKQANDRRKSKTSQTPEVKSSVRHCKVEPQEVVASPTKPIKTSRAKLAPLKSRLFPLPKPLSTEVGRSMKGTMKSTMKGNIKIRMMSGAVSSLHVGRGFGRKLVSNPVASTVSSKVMRGLAKNRQHFMKKEMQPVKLWPLCESKNNSKSDTIDSVTSYASGRGRGSCKVYSRFVRGLGRGRGRGTSRSDVSEHAGDKRQIVPPFANGTSEVLIKQAKFGAVMAPSAYVEPERKIPTLDAPLILDGKRERKPHVKLGDKWVQGARRPRNADALSSVESLIDLTEDSDYTPGRRNRTQVQSRLKATTSFLKMKVDKAKRYMSDRLPVASINDGSTRTVNAASLVQMRNQRKKGCCVCWSTILLGYHYKCSALICRGCARFYKSRRDRPDGGEALVCTKIGKCSTAQTGLRGLRPGFCAACKFKKCDFFYQQDCETQATALSVTYVEENLKHGTERTTSAKAQISPRQTNRTLNTQSSKVTKSTSRNVALTSKKSTSWVSRWKAWKARRRGAVADPEQSEHSSDKSGVIVDQSRVRQVQSVVSPDQSVVSPDQSGVSPDQSGVSPDESRLSPHMSDVVGSSRSGIGLSVSASNIKRENVDELFTTCDTGQRTPRTSKADICATSTLVKKTPARSIVERVASPKRSASHPPVSEGGREAGIAGDKSVSSAGRIPRVPDAVKRAELRKLFVENASMIERAENDVLEFLVDDEAVNDRVDAVNQMIVNLMAGTSRTPPIKVGARKVPGGVRSSIVDDPVSDVEARLEAADISRVRAGNKCAADVRFPTTVSCGKVLTPPRLSKTSTVMPRLVDKKLEKQESKTSSSVMESTDSSVLPEADTITSPLTGDSADSRLRRSVRKPIPAKKQLVLSESPDIVRKVLITESSSVAIENEAKEPLVSKVESASSDVIVSETVPPPSQVEDKAIALGTESEPVVIEEETEGDSSVNHRGPRIKHVCRRAAVALGKEPATFPVDGSKLRLSALPATEKNAAAGDASDAAESDDVSDDDVEGSCHADAELGGTPTAGPAGRGRPKGSLTRNHKPFSRKKSRTTRCQKCEGCLSPECGKCVTCRDLVKYGGNGVLKKACVKRLCSKVNYRGKFGTGEKPNIDAKNNKSQHESTSGSSESELSDSSDDFEDHPPEQEPKLTSSSSATSLSKMSLRAKRSNPFTSAMANRRGHKSKSTTFGETTLKRMDISSESRASKSRSETKAKTAVDDETSPKKNKETGRVSPTAPRINANKPRLPLTVAAAPVSTAASLALLAPPPAVVKTDFKNDFDLSTSWERGVALISSTPSCVRSVCQLCGSLGKQELIYCSVCCEGFHMFCMEEKNRPKSDGDLDSWCCQQCQYCHVCFGQEALIQCDRCLETFHPECLGPNYPTKPVVSNKKSIWVCCRCLRCKSCGTTNCENEKDVAWLHDYSLCYACGMLMEKGNFCPICHKCYVDDDWESQMIQCCTCHSWVHAKCEDLTDEMYQVVAQMPEDVPFNCRVCCPQKPSNWEVMVRHEMLIGMKKALDVVLTNSVTPLLQPITVCVSNTQGVSPCKSRPARGCNKVDVTCVGSNSVTSDAVSTSDPAVSMQNASSDAAASVPAVSVQNATSDAVSCVQTGSVQNASSDPVSCVPTVSVRNASSDAVSCVLTVSIENSSSDAVSSVPTVSMENASSDAVSIVPAVSMENASSETVSSVPAASMQNVSSDMVTNLELVLTAGEKASANLTAVNDNLTAVNDNLTAVNDNLTAVNDNLTAVNDNLTAVNDNLTAVNDINPHACVQTESSASLASDDLSACNIDSSVVEESDRTDCVQETCDSTSVLSAAAANGCSEMPLAVASAGDSMQSIDSDSSKADNVTKGSKDLSIIKTCKKSESSDLSVKPAVVDAVQCVAGHDTSSTVEAASQQPDSPVHCSQIVSDVTENRQLGDAALQDASEHLSTESALAVESSNCEKTSSGVDHSLSDDDADARSCDALSVAKCVKITDDEVVESVEPAGSLLDEPMDVESEASRKFPEGSASLPVLQEDSADLLMRNNNIVQQTVTCAKHDTDVNLPLELDSSLGDIRKDVDDVEPGETSCNKEVNGEVSSEADQCESELPMDLTTTDRSNGSHSEATDIPAPDGGFVPDGDGSGSKSSASDSASVAAPRMSRSYTRAQNARELEARIEALLQYKPFVRFEGVKREFPLDLGAVQKHLHDEVSYTSIEEFVSDTARIIQYNIEQGVEQREDTDGAVEDESFSSLKAAFVRQLEASFPWFDAKRSRYWSSRVMHHEGVLEGAVVPPTVEHSYANWCEKKKLSPPCHASLYRTSDGGQQATPAIGGCSLPGKAVVKDVLGGGGATKVDTRLCVLCWRPADEEANDAGRLIYAGQDDWIHVNCALWSAETYEEKDGTLKMVHSAMARGRKLRCDACGKLGATVGCCQQECNANFHFGCARRRNCVFLESSKIFCSVHRACADGDIVQSEGFSLSRRMFIDIDGNRWGKRQWISGLDPAAVNVHCGSLSVESLGRLTPLSDSRMALLPVNFRASRLYWSTIDSRRRCVYTCRIIEVIPKVKADVTRDITVAHDPMDPSYDAKLASKYLPKQRTVACSKSTNKAAVVELSDDDTVSASETDDDDDDDDTESAESLDFDSDGSPAEKRKRAESRNGKSKQNVGADHCYATGNGRAVLGRPRATNQHAAAWNSSGDWIKPSQSHLSANSRQLSKSQPAYSNIVERLSNAILQSRTRCLPPASSVGASPVYPTDNAGLALKHSDSESYRSTDSEGISQGDSVRPVVDNMPQLSESTLRLLKACPNLAGDRRRLQHLPARKIVTDDDDGGLGLVSIVNRLNEAAANNKRMSVCESPQEWIDDAQSGNRRDPGRFPSGTSDQRSDESVRLLSRISQTDGPMVDSDDEDLTKEKIGRATGSTANSSSSSDVHFLTGKKLQRGQLLNTSVLGGSGEASLGSESKQLETYGEIINNNDAIAKCRLAAGERDLTGVKNTAAKTSVASKDVVGADCRSNGKSAAGVSAGKKLVDEDGSRSETVLQAKLGAGKSKNLHVESKTNGVNSCIPASVSTNVKKATTDLSNSHVQNNDQKNTTTAKTNKITIYSSLPIAETSLMKLTSVKSSVEVPGNGTKSHAMMSTQATVGSVSNSAPAAGVVRANAQQSNASCKSTAAAQLSSASCMTAAPVTGASCKNGATKLNSTSGLAALPVERTTKSIHGSNKPVVQSIIQTSAAAVLSSLHLLSSSVQTSSHAPTVPLFTPIAPTSVGSTMTGVQRAYTIQTMTKSVSSSVALPSSRSAQLGTLGSAVVSQPVLMTPAPRVVSYLGSVAINEKDRVQVKRLIDAVQPTSAANSVGQPGMDQLQKLLAGTSSQPMFIRLGETRAAEQNVNVPSGSSLYQNSAGNMLTAAASTAKPPASNSVVTWQTSSTVTGMQSLKRPAAVADDDDESRTLAKRFMTETCVGQMGIGDARSVQLHCNLVQSVQPTMSMMSMPGLSQHLQGSGQLLPGSSQAVLGQPSLQQQVLFETLRQQMEEQRRVHEQREQEQRRVAAEQRAEFEKKLKEQQLKVQLERRMREQQQQLVLKEQQQVQLVQLQLDQRRKRLEERLQNQTSIEKERREMRLRASENKGSSLARVEQDHGRPKFPDKYRSKSSFSPSKKTKQSRASDGETASQGSSEDSGSLDGRKNDASEEKLENERFQLLPVVRPHLPEAEQEEEIENSPLVTMFEEEGRRTDETPTLKKDSPHLVFEITNEDGFKVQSDSFTKAWKAVTDRVQEARLSAHLKPVSFVAVDGLRMCGLTHPAVVYLLEQLPGARRMRNYKFKHHDVQYTKDPDDIEETPHGCSRAEPFSQRSKYEMFSFLLSRYRERPEVDPNTSTRDDFTANMSQRRQTSLDLPMAMRFRHLRTFAKEAVGVYRSGIHGRGLYCKRDIDSGEMIVEYSGEVIRAVLTDKREKKYESKGIGCYMFRKDNDHVIDSTVMGNAARFINHSCEPNCYSKVILVENRRHIVIFALREIKRGEELTYDYKFPIEDVKIPCLCGSRRCRKYLN